MVAAVIADIIGSRRLQDRAAAQRTLEQTIERVERERPLALQPLAPTVGDELQGVYAGLGQALVSTLLLQLALPDEVMIRFGIGIGGIRSIDSAGGGLTDGPGWWAARAAIEAVHDRESATMPRARTWIVGASGQDEVMADAIANANAYLLVRDELVGAMSERERRLVQGRLNGVAQRDLAQQEGITQPSVSKALRRSGAAALLLGVDGLLGAVL